jgi:hypothetical protein
MAPAAVEVHHVHAWSIYGRGFAPDLHVHRTPCADPGMMVPAVNVRLTLEERFGVAPSTI